MSGRENVFLNGALLGFSRRQTAAHYRRIVEFAGLGHLMDQKLKNYSTGMKVRLAFACATMPQPDILLVDEVLAVGDADFQRKGYDYFESLKKGKTTVVLVTHDMNAVRQFCDRAALIEQSRLVALGRPTDIAADYLQLFTENDAGGTPAPGGTSGPHKRWGNGAVVVEEVAVDPRTPTDKAWQIEIVVTLTGVRPYDGGLVSGFVVRDATGEALIGSSTQIEQRAIPQLDTGQRCAIRWTCPNLFADGRHTIDVAVHNTDGVTIYDWLEEAASFYEKREKETGYKVVPRLQLVDWLIDQVHLVRSRPTPTMAPTSSSANWPSHSPTMNS